MAGLSDYVRDALVRAGIMRQQQPAVPAPPPNVDDEAARARAGAEQINAALPQMLSARQAVLEKRRQLAEMDRMLQESQR